jgi:formate-dependent nitrite reductase membrane component NrfD
MTATYGKEMMCSPRQQLEWGFGGRRKVRDGALLMALFLGGIGAGQFVVSTWLFDYWQSAVIGLLFVAVGKSAAHLMYLGRPSRFPRLFLRPLTSWISRGFIAMVALCVFGAAYLAPHFSEFTWLPWTVDSDLGRVFLGVAMVAAFIVMIYDGFVLASCKSIASWHTMLLPVMFFVYAIAGGLAMTALTTIAAKGPVSVDELASLDTFLLGAMVALVALYVINLATSDTTAKESLRTLLVRRTAIVFVGLAILAGLLIPLALAVFHQVGIGATLANALLAGSALLELCGDLSVRHSILRAGLHAPVF